MKFSKPSGEKSSFVVRSINSYLQINKTANAAEQDDLITDTDERNLIMSTFKITKQTLPSFHEIDRLVQKGRKERALAFSAALKSLTTGAEAETQPTLAGAVRA